MRESYRDFQKKAATPGTQEHALCGEALEMLLKNNPLTGKPVAPKSAAAVRRARKLGLPFVLRLN